MMRETKIKMCGFTNEKTALNAIALGVHYIGLIFHPESKRDIEPSKAKRLVEKIKGKGAIAVGVFVNQSALQIQSICQYTGISTVQLHGDLPRRQHSLLPSSFVKLLVVSVDEAGCFDSRVQDAISLLDLSKDFLLFDSVRPGTGTVVSHMPINKVNQKARYFIAGGLNDHTVKKCIAQYRPFGVDVCSGIESQPGVKDSRLMMQFSKRCKEVNNEFIDN